MSKDTAPGGCTFLGQVEVVSQTAKALLLAKAGPARWFPKSVVQKTQDSLFGDLYWCKTWFVARNRLWDWADGKY